MRLSSSYPIRRRLSRRAALSSRLQVASIPGEFDIRQACATIISSLYHDLIRTYSRRGFKALTGPERHVVVLVDTVPTYPHASYQLPVFVQRDTASKDLGAILDTCNIARTAFRLTRRG